MWLRGIFAVTLTSLVLAAGGFAQDKAPPTAVSPDQKLTALGQGQAIRIIDSAGGKVILQLQGHTGIVRTLAFSPDGKLLASGAADKGINLWDIRSGKQLMRIQLSAGIVSVTFSKDGRHLTAQDENQTERVFESSTGRQVQKKLDG